MTARNVTYLSEARLEAEAALDWYLERSQTAATAFVAELNHAIEIIREAPQVWPLFEGDARRYVLRKFPFSIIYGETVGGVLVVAVAHQKRKPGYWKSRPDA